eukprot:jgi/Chrzof1/7066/Cz02g09150.t1
MTAASSPMMMHNTPEARVAKAPNMTKSAPTTVLATQPMDTTDDLTSHGCTDVVILRLRSLFTFKRRKRPTGPSVEVLPGAPNTADITQGANDSVVSAKPTAPDKVKAATAVTGDVNTTPGKMSKAPEGHGVQPSGASYDERSWGIATGHMDHSGAGSSGSKALGGSSMATEDKAFRSTGSINDALGPSPPSRTSSFAPSITPYALSSHSGYPSSVSQAYVSSITGLPASMTDMASAGYATSSSHQEKKHKVPICWEFNCPLEHPVRIFWYFNSTGSAPPVRVVFVVCKVPGKEDSHFDKETHRVILPDSPPLPDVKLNMCLLEDIQFPADSFLGAGAFGQVHRALHHYTTPVAVKMLTNQAVQHGGPHLKSFAAELAIMSKLCSPNIVRCFGGNANPPSPFIVMELCAFSLSEVIAAHAGAHPDHGLSLYRTLKIGTDIASALWVMHPTVVHRDLKPQNVMLDGSGVAKVADFGLTRMKTEAMLSTQHLDVGTIAYMAPECFEAKGVVTEKCDIYALGIILWECITGQKPYKGYPSQYSIIFEVTAHDHRPELPPAAPHAPQELLDIVTACWAKNPAERPGAEEVRSRLKAMLDKVPVPDIMDEIATLKQQGVFQ